MLLRGSRSRRYIRSDSQVRDRIRTFEAAMKPVMIEHDLSVASEEAAQFLPLERR